MKLYIARAANSTAAIAMIVAPGEEATHADCGFRSIVPLHSAIAFLDPPADSPFSTIIGTVDCFTIGAGPNSVSYETASRFAF